MNEGNLKVSLGMIIAGLPMLTMKIMIRILLEAFKCAKLYNISGLCFGRWRFNKAECTTIEVIENIVKNKLILVR